MSEMDEAELELAEELAGAGADALVDDGPAFEEMLDDELDESDPFYDLDEDFADDSDDSDESNGSSGLEAGVDADAVVSEPVTESAEPVGPEGDTEQVTDPEAEARAKAEAEAQMMSMLAGMTSKMASTELGAQEQSEAAGSTAPTTDSDTPLPTSSVVDTDPVDTAVVAPDPASPGDEAGVAGQAGQTGPDGQYVTNYSRVREQLRRGRTVAKPAPSQEMNDLLDRSKQAWRDRPVSKLVAPVTHTMIILSEDEGSGAASPGAAGGSGDPSASDPADSGSAPGSAVCVNSGAADTAAGARDRHEGDSAGGVTGSSSGAVWVAGQDGIDVQGGDEQGVAFTQDGSLVEAPADPGQPEQTGQLGELEQAAPDQAAESVDAPVGSPVEGSVEESAVQPEPAHISSVPVDAPVEERDSPSAPVGAGQVDLAAAYAALDPLEQELLCDELGLVPAEQVRQVRDKARLLVSRLRGKITELQSQVAAEHDQVELLRARLVMGGGSGAAAGSDSSEGGMAGEVTGQADLPGRADPGAAAAATHGGEVGSAGSVRPAESTKSAEPTAWSLAALRNNSNRRDGGSSSDSGGHGRSGRDSYQGG